MITRPPNLLPLKIVTTQINNNFFNIIQLSHKGGQGGTLCALPGYLQKRSDSEPRELIAFPVPKQKARKLCQLHLWSTKQMAALYLCVAHCMQLFRSTLPATTMYSLISQQSGTFQSPYLTGISPTRTKKVHLAQHSVSRSILEQGRPSTGAEL